MEYFTKLWWHKSFVIVEHLIAFHEDLFDERSTVYILYIRVLTLKYALKYINTYNNKVL